MEDGQIADSVRYMTLLSSLMIGILGILIAYASELGTFISLQILLDFTIFPAIYIATYSIFLFIKPFEKQRHKKLRDRYFVVAQVLVNITVVLVAIFLFVMAFQDVIIRHSLLGTILIVIIWSMLIAALGIFGLMVSYIIHVWRH